MGDILQHLRASQEHFAYHTMHGLRILSLNEGYAEVLMPASDTILNPLGKVHGGAIYTLCDVTAGSAAASRGRVAVTLSSSMSYLHAGKAGYDLIGRSREVKTGRTTSVYEIEVWQQDRIIAIGTFTMFYSEQETVSL